MTHNNCPHVQRCASEPHSKTSTSPSPPEQTTTTSASAQEKLVITEQEFQNEPFRIRVGGHQRIVLGVFRAWLRDHFWRPFPTQSEYMHLQQSALDILVAEDPGSSNTVTIKQIHHWFYNSRYREWLQLLTIADRKWGTAQVDKELAKGSSRLLNRAQLYRKNPDLFKRK
ncbi:MAG: hypothetical protein EXX96DRAFT_653285 [Benjaminiella poitrasii]|nr:MAG: hypothetical protein EXX96DRAFT_653285 [Benjaminiella poitrasii]